jgi:hypothetical protein
MAETTKPAEAGFVEELWQVPDGYEATHLMNV